MLVDSHCHLDRLALDNYAGGLDEALAAAKAAGVQRFLTIGVSRDNAEQMVAYAGRYNEVYASVGIHPLQVADDKVDAQWLRQWGQQHKVVAIGETGLDYYYDDASGPAQRDSFALHLQVAGELRLPVVVHTRAARADTLALIKDHGSSESAGVLHCFTEDWDTAKALLDMNFYIAISGIVTFRNAQQLREVVRKLPPERLLLETDAPYLAPVPHRGKSNEPRYLPAVAACCAELKGMDVAQLSAITSANFERLFKLGAAT